MQAAELWEFDADGSMSKPQHPGKAALDGVLAADSARLGFSGARDCRRACAAPQRG